MLQQFLLKQAINLIVSLVVKYVDEQKESFNVQAIKESVDEKIKDLVPQSLWGEQWVEEKLCGVSDFMIDALDKSMNSVPKLVQDVLGALSEQSLERALSAVKEFFLGAIGAGERSTGVAVQAADDTFASVMLNAFNEQQSQEGEGQMAQKTNDPGVNTLGAQQQQGEKANASEEQDPIVIEKANEQQEKLGLGVPEEKARMTQAVGDALVEPQLGEKDQAQKEPLSFDGKGE